MEVSVVDWNLNGWHTIEDEQIDLLRSLDADFMLLQEVTPRSFEKLQRAGFESGVFAKQHLPEGHRGAAKGSRVRFWAGLFVTQNWEVRNAEVLMDLPSPERTMVARIEAPTPFIAGSFAVPPGVTWFDRKTEQGAALAKWMDSRRMPVIAGIDRNGPKSYEADGAASLWPHDAEELHDPARLRNVRDLRPGEGVPAVSYRRGRGERTTPCRYDAIYASSRFQVEELRYMYEEAINAGSDHGLVLARLRLT